MSTKLQGALRWSAAEEAAVRISVIRDSIAGGGSDSKQLRHGLNELDSIRTFLQEGINSCNQEFLDNGTTDGVLHNALEKGLSELEDVRRKVVTKMSTSTATGGGPSKAGVGSAAKESGGASTVHLRRQRPPSAPAARGGARKDSDGPQRSSSFSVNGIGGTRATMMQRSSSAKTRPMSATNRPTSATNRPTSATRRFGVNANDSGPTRTAARQGWNENSTGASNTATNTATKPNIPSRMRPSSAPNRHRSSSAPAKDTSNDHTVQSNDAQKSTDIPTSETSAWGKYQDWAQSVLNRVQSRRVQQHRQTLSKQRSGSTSEAGENGGTTQPPAGPTRPMSGKAPLAQGPTLRRAQTASVRQPPSGSATSSGVQRPQSAGMKLGAQAQALREQGNIHFQQKKYRESAECYSRALDLEPTSETLYCNRAATYLMMNKYTDALHDALKAIDMDPTHVKAHWRAAKAYLYLGHPDDAKAMYGAAQKLAEGPDRESVSAELRTVDLIEKCRRCLRLREWQEALRCADGILEVFPASGPCSMPWMCLKAEALVHIDSTEANNQLGQMCADESCTSECWYLRAKAMFYTGHDAVSTNSCLTYLQKARELDSSNTRVQTLEQCITSFSKLRDDGNGAYAAGKWQEAYLAYTKCLSVDAYNNSLKAIILCNRAAVCIQCERWRDALDDINQSIGFNPHNAKAYTRRARIHQHNNSHEAAVKDLQLAVQMYPSAENQERLTQATELKNQYQRQQKQQQQQQQQGGSGSFRYFNFASGQGHGQQQYQQSHTGAQRPYTAGAKRPQSANRQAPAAPAQPRQRTHYDTLGLNRNCDERSIVKAYRDAALKWHPDKWASASAEQKAMAESTFKEVSVAYNTLKDSSKRRQYDLTLVF